MTYPAFSAMQSRALSILEAEHPRAAGGLQRSCALPCLALLLLLAACGGGGSDVPDVPSPGQVPPVCQTNPAACS